MSRVLGGRGKPEDTQAAVFSRAQRTPCSAGLACARPKSSATAPAAGRTVKRVFAKGAAPASPPLTPSEEPPDVGLHPLLREYAGKGWRILKEHRDRLPNLLQAGPITKYRQRRMAVYYVTRNLKGSVKESVGRKLLYRYSLVKEACSSCDERARELPFVRAAALLADRRRREEVEARHLLRLTGRPTGTRSGFHLSTLLSA